MFQRILLPIDLSDRHEPALKMAVSLCAPDGGEILLVHVIELISGLSFDEERPFYDRLRQNALEHLEQLGQRLEECGVRWRIDLRLGHRVHQIVESARENTADLIVLTCPRPDLANPLSGLGSLSFRVSLLTPCPVLLVR